MEGAETDTKRDSLLAAAAQFDSGAGVGTGPDADAPTQGADAGANEAANAAESGNETGAKAGDGAEGSVGTEAKPQGKADNDKAGRQGEEGKPNDAQSKFAREQARKAKTWEAINSEREQFRKEREAFQRERDEWAKGREQSQVQDLESFRDKKGYTAKDYEEAAKVFEADGDRDKAILARQKAEEVRASARETVEKQAAEKFNNEWKASFDRLSQHEPWLKDDNSPQNKRAVELLQQFPMLTRDPHGLSHAVAIVKLEEKASLSEKLEAQVKDLTGQLEKLTKKTQIGRGPATKPIPSEAKPFEKMSLDEQRAHLLNKASEFDGVPA